MSAPILATLLSCLTAAVITAAAVHHARAVARRRLVPVRHASRPRD